MSLLPDVDLTKVLDDEIGRKIREFFEESWFR
jgi:hypothetical protein